MNFLKTWGYKLPNRFPKEVSEICSPFSSTWECSFPCSSINTACDHFKKPLFIGFFLMWTHVKINTHKKNDPKFQHWDNICLWLENQTALKAVKWKTSFSHDFRPQKEPQLTYFSLYIPPREEIVPICVLNVNMHVPFLKFP